MLAGTVQGSSCRTQAWPTPSQGLFVSLLTILLPLLLMDAGRQAHLWWAAAGSGLRCALVALLDDLPPDLPLMLLATAELPADTAAAASLPSSSSRRRLLTAPGAAAAAAGGGAAGHSIQQRMQQQQQQEHLEELGMDPSLAALFPPLGQVSDTQGQQLQGVQVPASTPAAQQRQTAALGQHQQDAGRGCDVLGWVLLDSPGPNERRGMFKVTWTVPPFFGSLTNPCKHFSAALPSTFEALALQPSCCRQNQVVPTIASAQ